MNSLQKRYYELTGLHLWILRFSRPNKNSVQIRDPQFGDFRENGKSYRRRLLQAIDEVQTRGKNESIFR